MDEDDFPERTPDEQAVEAVLHEYGVFGGDRHDQLVRDLAAALGGGEWWNQEQIAEHFEVKLSSVSSMLSQYKVKRHLLARADEVRAAKARRRGSGWRAGQRNG